jgi:kinesin family protein 6/9
MTGATENYKHRGIIPRAISQIFRMIGEKPELQVKTKVSYLEIYNETILDLLSSVRLDEDDSEGTSLSVVEDKSNGSSLNVIISCVSD